MNHSPAVLSQQRSALSAMILAGGKSSRMGRDKALLKIEGQPLLLRTVHIAKQLTNDIAVVTAHPQRYQSVLPPTVRLVREPTTEGPLKGMLEGWQHINSQWCLVLACDLPYLDPSELIIWWHWVLEQLPILDSSRKDSAPIASLVPGPKGWEPLCGYYHRSCIATLRTYLSATTHRTAQPSFQAWLATAAIEPYPNLSRRVLFNCNTPQDWQTVQTYPPSPPHLS